MTTWYTRDPDAITHWTTHDPLVAGIVGRLYVVIGLAAGWSDPSASEIKLGQLSGGGAAVASGNVLAPVVTTVFDWPSVLAGLTSGVSYRAAYVWSDSLINSNVVVTAPFTTASIGRVKYWDGAAWALKPTKVWDGAVWAPKTTKVWSGSAWV